MAYCTDDNELCTSQLLLDASPSFRITVLRMKLLGDCSVFVGNREVNELTSQPTRAALLVYLAVEGGAGRDQLLGVLWPDWDPSGARHALSQTLSWLRQNLGEDRIRVGGERKSFWRLQQVDLGMSPEWVLNVQLALPLARYQQQADVVRFYSTILHELERNPRIEHVGVINRFGLTHGHWNLTFVSDADDPENRTSQVEMRFVAGDYFAAMGIPLLEGRASSESDGPGAPYVPARRAASIEPL